MAYAKAAELLELALDVAGRRHGMAYAEIDARSSAPSPDARRRNTQRQVRALERLFGDRVTTSSDERGKYVLLQGGTLRGIIDLEPQELAALDRGAELLAASNAVLEADSLAMLSRKLQLLRSGKSRNRVDVDYAALLESSHVLVRPGPRPVLEPAQMAPLTQALLAIRQLSFNYAGQDGVPRRRQVHPYGIIAGHRAYLLAVDAEAPDDLPVLWRVDRMANVSMCDEAATRPDDFDLAAFARRSFGVFHDENEYGEVEWRFRADVAERVLGFRFHPDQSMTVDADGAVTVRFYASGWLEMAWALYPWGDSVEVIRPASLRALVEGHQRSDFGGVP